MHLLKNGSNELEERLSKLENVKFQLKKEFFGIDDVIDRVIDMMSSWYALPQLQTKPLIINLWGMTGIGKTSLVERIVELLNIEDRYFPFDVGENERGSAYSIRNLLEDIYKIQNSNSIILSFDEFQYARSINENYHEIKNSSARVIWEILGSGKFSFTPSYQDIYELSNYYKYLHYQIMKGIKVVNGNVLNQPEKFKATHERSIFIYESITSETSFFSSMYIDYLYELISERYHDRQELIEHLLTLNAQETLELIRNALDTGSAHKFVDCSNALIFIIGNIDEAYRISGNFNPDISADIYYKETKKINLTSIKKVLRKRFRNEQIARLGNNHVIYPSLNSEAFRAIINAELGKVQRLIKSKFNVALRFEGSLIDLLYNEGVFPTQGARPLHTTIDNVVGSNISKILYEGIKLKKNFDSIIISSADDKLQVKYYFNNKQVGQTNIKLSLLTENRRKSKSDDIQAITAVHESGHAILLRLLLNIEPEGIISVSADDSYKGLTLTSDSEERIISKKSMINENAVNLGGYAAEKLVFGEPNITSGSMTDYENATEFTTMMVKRAGLGDQIGSYDNDDNYQLRDDNMTVNNEVKALLKKSYNKSEAILKQNYKLLLNVANYLSTNSFMSKEKFMEYFHEYAEDEVFNNNENFYKNKLKEELENNTQFNFNFTGTYD